MDADLDLYVERLREGKHLPESVILDVCRIVKAYLVEEANVQTVAAPVTVCGDLHGQLWDVLELFRIGGDLKDTKYIFLGDFVDRGYYSLETISLLLCLKARWPERITLLRGNHESRQVTQVYGFYDECFQKYGSACVWKACCSVFDFMSLAAIIDDDILCVHGGLSPDIKSIDQIRVIVRAQEIPHEGAFCDLLWSDPEDVDSWAVSPRGAGWLFGRTITKEFCHINDLKLVARAHQLVQEGYKFMFAPENNLVTVWSAPNYCYRCGNIASIMQVPSGGDVTDDSFKLFDAVPNQEHRGGSIMGIPKYFL